MIKKLVNWTCNSDKCVCNSGWTGDMKKDMIKQLQNKIDKFKSLKDRKKD